MSKSPKVSSVQQDESSVVVLNPFHPENRSSVEVINPLPEGFEPAPAETVRPIESFFHPAEPSAGAAPAEQKDDRLGEALVGYVAVQNAEGL